MDPVDGTSDFAEVSDEPISFLKTCFEYGVSVDTFEITILLLTGRDQYQDVGCLSENIQTMILLRVIPGNSSPGLAAS